MPARTLTTTRPAAGTTTHQPTRVVLYVRVSSKDQEAEGFSIPAQSRLLREYAAIKGFTIEREFVDIETAKASGRTHFSEMLAYLKKHPAAVPNHPGREDRPFVPESEGLGDARRAGRGN